MQYLDTGCFTDNMCDRNKYLLCSNSTCQCNSLKKMDSAKQKCRYNYLGCFYDSNTNSSLIFSQRNSYYFIDICIKSCKYGNYNYTTIFNYNNQKFCYCLNSGPLISSQSCSSYCFSKDNEEYSCGSNFDMNSHAYYYNF